MDALRVNIISTDNTKGKKILFYIFYIISQVISGYLLYYHVKPKTEKGHLKPSGSDFCEMLRTEFLLYCLYIAIALGFLKIFFTEMFEKILSLKGLNISDMSFIFICCCVYVTGCFCFTSISDDVFKAVRSNSSDWKSLLRSSYYLALMFAILWISLKDGLIGYCVSVVYFNKGNDLDIFYSTSNGVECMLFNSRKNTSTVNMCLIFEVDLEKSTISLLNKRIQGESGFNGFNYKITMYNDHDYKKYKDKVLIIIKTSVNFYDPKLRTRSIYYLDGSYIQDGEEYAIDDVVSSDEKWAYGNLAPCAHFINKALIKIYEKYDMQQTNV